MYSDVIYSFAIGFVGAILFLLVDKHEPDGSMALLKFLILFVAGVAVLHKLQPYGLALFLVRIGGARELTPHWIVHAAYPRMLRKPMRDAQRRSRLPLHAQSECLHSA